MRVCFGRDNQGNHFAKTTIPVMGGHVTLIAKCSERELREMYRRHACGSIQGDDQDIGFRLSLKKLGGAIKAIAKPATLLKVTTMAARLSAGDPTALLQAPGLIKSVRQGMAAKKVMEAAADGNPKAISILARARAAAQTGDAAPHVPGIDPGVMRYLLTIQKLGRVQASA